MNENEQKWKKYVKLKWNKNAKKNFKKRCKKKKNKEISKWRREMQMTLNETRQKKAGVWKQRRGNVSGTTIRSGWGYSTFVWKEFSF